MDNKLPITRLSKFISQDDFDLHQKIGQEYLHGDLNMKLVLYRVNSSKTDLSIILLDSKSFFPLSVIL